MCMWLQRTLVVLGVLSLMAPTLAPAAASEGRPGVFERPAIAELERRAAEALAAGDRDAAHRLLGAVLARDPASAVARRGLAALGTPVPEAPPVPERAPIPRRVVDGVARVGDGNTRWRAGDGMLESLFAFPPRGPRSAPPADPAERSRVARLLLRLHAAGRAAGNLGDLYDNRDRGHAALPAAAAPQLAHVVYAPAAKAAGLDYGLNRALAFNAPTIGNSSTAVVSGPLRRSLPRLAMTTPGLIETQWRHYADNRIYVFPAHKDVGDGDMFPALTPYMLVSRGSSRSDLPLVQAVAAALAAFPPAAKRRMVAEGLTAPTVQAVLRGVLADARGGGDPLDPRAHPTAIDGGDLELEAVVRAANAITADGLPPMPRLRVERETRVGLAPTLPEAGPSEVLFDTPGAAARVFRGLERERRYVVSLAQTVDPNGRPLRFRWAVLRGDPARVVVRPLDARGETVEISVAWGAWRAPEAGPDAPARVDVAAVADNGVAVSAPAYFSVAFDPRERRAYGADGRLVAVDARPRGERLDVDPALFAPRPWRDEALYGPDGAWIGLRRVGEGGTRRYTRHGAIVLETDPLGRPALARETVHEVVAVDGVLVARERPTGFLLRYGYDDDGDFLGFLDGRMADRR